jgi:hypothetical protein
MYRNMAVGELQVALNHLRPDQSILEIQLVICQSNGPIAIMLRVLSRVCRRSMNEA